MMFPFPGPGGGFSHIVGGGTPDLIDEDFEGSGTPPSWFSGGAGANFDYSASPLSGSQSFRLTADYSLTKNFADTSEIWLQMLYKAESLPGGSFPILSFAKSDTTSMCEIDLNPDGTLTIGSTVSGTPTTVSALSAGTAYNIWFHYKNVSSGNCIIEASFDVAGNPRPNSGNKHVSASDGFLAGNIGYVYFKPPSVNEVFDNVKVSSTDIF